MTRIRDIAHRGDIPHAAGRSHSKGLTACIHVDQGQPQVQGDLVCAKGKGPGSNSSRIFQNVDSRSGQGVQHRRATSFEAPQFARKTAYNMFPPMSSVKADLSRPAGRFTAFHWVRGSGYEAVHQAQPSEQASPLCRSR